MKFYGQGKLDKYLYESLFQNVTGGFFVECGANNGVTESTCKFFEETMGWTGINIEPVPFLFKKLEIERPDCINLRCALSDKEGAARFKNAIHPTRGKNFGNGSLSHAKEHIEDLVKQGCSFEEFDVQCRKFNNIAIENKINKIDLFVLDVEGHEAPALNGILPQKPNIFCVEHTLSGLENIKSILLNYKLHSVYRHNAIFILK